MKPKSLFSWICIRKFALWLNLQIKKKIGVSQSGTCSKSTMQSISSVPSLCESVVAGKTVFPTLKLPWQTKGVFQKSPECVILLP